MFKFLRNFSSKPLTDDEIKAKTSFNQKRLLNCINKYKGKDLVIEDGRIYKRMEFRLSLLGSPKYAETSTYIPNPRNQREWEDCKRDYENGFFNRYVNINIPYECFKDKNNWND
jgi:hypothetical protein